MAACTTPEAHGAHSKRPHAARTEVAGHGEVLPQQLVLLDLQASLLLGERGPGHRGEAGPKWQQDDGDLKIVAGSPAAGWPSRHGR